MAVVGGILKSGSSSVLLNGVLVVAEDRKKLRRGKIDNIDIKDFSIYWFIHII